MSAMLNANTKFLAFTRYYFTDHLDYGAMLQSNYGISFRSVQLSPGTSSYHMDCFELPAEHLWVARTRPTQREYSEFEVPEGYLLISACRHKVPVYCNGLSLNQSQFFIFPGGQKVRAVYADSWDGLDILVRMRYLEQRKILAPLHADMLARSTPLISDSLVPETVQFIEELAGFFDDAEKTNDIARHHSLTTNVVDYTLSNLRHILVHQFGYRNRAMFKQTRRTDIVVKAVDYISENVAEDLQAKDIAKELGVCYRTLGYAFKDAFDISPYQFILIKKLHAVREKLKESSDSVNSVADQYAFTTPSRFRKQYSRLFGELPSQTRAISNYH